MTPKRRDYKAEYAQRIQKGLERGFTRSQAAGHPKKTELSLRQITKIQSGGAEQWLGKLVAEYNDVSINSEYKKLLDIEQQIRKTKKGSKKYHSLLRKKKAILKKLKTAVRNKEKTDNKKYSPMPFDFGES